MEYDLDGQDEDFLEAMNSRVETRLTEDQFEQIIDRLEKEAYQRVRINSLLFFFKK